MPDDRSPFRHAAERDALVVEREMSIFEVPAQIWWAGLVCLAVGSILCFAEFYTHATKQRVGLGLLAAGVALVASRNAFRSERRDVPVRFDAEGVHIFNRLRVRRESIVRGRFETRSIVSPFVRRVTRGTPRLELIGSLGRLLFSCPVADEAAAAELLLAMGVASAPPSSS
jgi:hypothetical protein